MKTYCWIAAPASLSLASLSVWQIRAAESGLRVERLSTTSPPVTLIMPERDSSRRPVVLIAHGFAASRVIMRSFGLTLAHAGFNVVLWDFSGHGAKPNPLPPGRRIEDLVADAEAALAQARQQGLDGASGIAILGHSMGSGVALSFGQIHPDTRATIAISPVPIPVTPELAHNLLLMAGSLEAPFVSNAKSCFRKRPAPAAIQGPARGAS